MVAIYWGALLFGGGLIAASLFGAGDHGFDAHADTGGGDGHGGGGWLSIFGLRFWSFGAAFFGLSGVLLHHLGGAGLAALAPLVSAGVGVASGLGASSAFRLLSRDAVGQVAEAAALVGREGRLLLPVAGDQRGKVRLPSPGGGHVDLVAESGDDEPLAAGAEVLVVEVRGNVAVVARAPASLPARGS